MWGCTDNVSAAIENPAEFIPDWQLDVADLTTLILMTRAKSDLRNVSDFESSVL
jgi:hypothetical protein